MKTIIISADHRDETGKYWSDSYVKRTQVTLEEGETIHEAIVRVISECDSCTFAYKGKPQGNVYRDDREGNTRIVGYHYRTKHFISEHGANISRDNVPFTTWVTIHGELNDVELDDIEK